MELEQWAWGDLFSREKEGLSSLGISPEMWDCHINHYSGLWWRDIVELGHAQHYVALGWDVDAWENGAPKPDSDDAYWDELSPEEQYAAAHLCYSKYLWDQDPLNEWPAPETRITSLSPTRSPTLHPTTPEPTSSEPTLRPSSARPTTSEPTSSQPTASPVTPAPSTSAPVTRVVGPERALPLYPVSRYVRFKNRSFHCRDNCKILTLLENRLNGLR